MENEIIQYLEEYLNIFEVKLEDNIREILIKNESNKKGISYEEELKYQIQEYIKDTIFYPIDINYIKLLQSIENKFNIEIHDYEIENINNVLNLIKLINQKLNKYE
jgi:acyl carrier protein